MDINPVQVFVAIFYDVMWRCLEDTVEVGTECGLVLPGTMHELIMCRTEHEFAIGGRRADLSLQNFYNASLVVNWKSFERLKVFLPSALLKSSLDHHFLVTILLHIVAVISMFECTLEQVDVKLI